jgi:hypothetical protein
MKRIAVAVLGALWIAGCGAQPLDEATLRSKESALTKLARTLDAVVRFQQGSAALDEQALKAVAWKEEAEQVRAFDGYLLRVRREGRNSSVLVCTADGARGLWEDAGCKAKLEERWWDQPAAPCAFRIDLAKVCN